MIPLACGFWLVAFGFQTLSPHTSMPFPPLLPAAPQGRRRRRRWLYRADQPLALLCPMAPQLLPPAHALSPVPAGAKLTGW